MAAATTADAIGNLIKETWTDEEVYEYLVTDDAFFGMVEKDWNTTGLPIKAAIEFSGDGGYSARFSDAQTYYNSSGDVDWTLDDLFDCHVVFQITNKTILSMRDRGALVNALEHTIGKQLKKLKRNMNIDLWRSTDGARGQIESGGGTATLVLTDFTDAKLLEIGDYVVSHNTLTGTTDDNEPIRIAGLNPLTRTVTLANATGAGNFANGDYLFVVGTKGRKLPGVPAWVPTADPSATLFNGVDRTQHITALSGVRMDSSASLDGNMTNALRRLAATIQDMDGEPSDCFLPSLDWSQCSRELGNPLPVMVNAVDKSGDVIGHIGYSTIVLQTAAGPVRLHPCKHLSRGRAWMLDMKTWKIVGNREPGLDQKDGNRILRMNTAAAQEGRFEAYWNLICKIPGHNGTMSLSAVTIN